ncbi:unnamed protein product [Medioppia subpectinata]|uniref:Carboxylesterase type B domain-containing protein n=1 Tax=Medioppia subpectinata TaxID=1979941 RepID=A0A7R9KRD8_9ACAR|nr:unnamed protein product [Medioppia subpectinata]CAG2107303.1 unnamed protein product [Medioppia subpectinata]
MDSRRNHILSDDILGLIFNELNVKQLLRLESICNQFVDCVGSALQRKKGLRIGYKSSDYNRGYHSLRDNDIIEALVPKDAYLYNTSVIIYLSEIKDILNSILGKCLNVKSLDFKDVIIDGQMVSMITSLCPRLKRLSLNGWDINVSTEEVMIWKALLSQLSHLTLEKAVDDDIRQVLPQLSSLESIEFIDLHHNNAVIDEVFAYLPQSIRCLQLKHMGVRNELSLDLLMKSCPHLEVLSMGQQMGQQFYNVSDQGIPFAEPPVNELRFAKPVPLRTKWQTVYPAKQITAQCVSPFNTSKLIAEDCLHLNIWTPSTAVTANRPVMFWIYGGSFIMGSATKQVDGYNIFDGRQLAARDVVVVTANYRLGVFGFLYGNSSEAPGNQGLWDQVMALKWIKAEIRNFGGNPDDVTIFGVSAGSMSVSAHVVSPESRSLFKKGIMQSGAISLRETPNSGQSALRFSRDFATNKTYFPTNPCANTTATAEWIKCLKSKTTDELNKAQEAVFYATFTETSGTPFKSIYGDQFLPKDFSRSLADADFKTNVNLLIGHSEMEGVSFSNDFDTMFGLNGRYNPRWLSPVTKDQVWADIRAFMPLPADTQLMIANAYTNQFRPKDQSLELTRAAAHAYGDAGITCPTVIFGAQLVTHRDFKGSVHQYRLSYANSKSISYDSYWAEAEHTDEQPLVFGRPLNEPDNGWTATDKEISKTFVTLWTDFAKTGKLTIGGQEWPKYTVRTDGAANVSYVELNPRLKNSYAIRVNRYRGGDDPTVKAINNCLDF